MLCRPVIDFRSLRLRDLNLINDSIDTALSECAQQGLLVGRGSVRLSVCTTVCLIVDRSRGVRRVCCWATCDRGTALSSKCEQCHFDSWRRKLNRLVFLYFEDRRRWLVRGRGRRRLLSSTHVWPVHLQYCATSSRSIPLAKPRLD